MPGDRKLNKRIAEGEYTDVTHWWEGEERRWRFGHGKGALKEGEEEDVGGVTEHFRWREWMGLAKESRRELKTRKGSIERDTKGRQPSDTDGPTHYSVSKKRIIRQAQSDGSSSRATLAISARESRTRPR
jgi:hypothetical protein